MDSFKHQLGDRVGIAILGDATEYGEVTARAQYASGEDQYQVRYRAADGRATESWWPASALIDG